VIDPSKRFVTALLAAGVAVLLTAILIGEHMGDRVLVDAVDTDSTATTPLITPLPEPSSSGPYGPGWKNSQTLAAAPDPGFPDPRVPPKPLPTAATPSPKPSPASTWTPNPNLPIWDQTPPPSPGASPTTFSQESTQGSPSPQVAVTPR